VLIGVPSPRSVRSTAHWVLEASHAPRG